MVSANKAELEYLKRFSSPRSYYLATGRLGMAILKGIAQKQDQWAKARYLASVQSDKSAQELREAFPPGSHKSGPITLHLEVLQGENLEVMKRSDLVILDSPPDTIEAILREPGMAAAMARGSIVSLAPGITMAQMEAALYPEGNQNGPRINIARATPNIAAAHGKSTTAIAVAPAVIFHPEHLKLDFACSFFSCVGDVTTVPEFQMDAASLVCGKSPAFMALVCDAIIDGAVAGGLPRKQAERLTVQAMASTAVLLAADGGTKRPSEVRETMCESQGPTFGATLEMEMGGVGVSISLAVQEAILAARNLGKKGG